MGLLENILQDSGDSLGEISAGTVILATAFDSGRRFKVKLLSQDVVGQGGSATVTQGEVTTVDRKQVVVALKTFHFSLKARQEETDYRLYLKELEAIKLLGGENRYVPPFLGTASLYDRPIIVSQFMANGNLLEYIERQAKLGRRVSRQVLLVQVAEALAFLHEVVGLVHGDLKCENVLISDDHRALLADFGLSALIHKAEKSALTSTSIRERNTVRFAAPELLSDTAICGELVRSKTTYSDAWAFGMLIVQAFTSKHPWPEYSTELAAFKILTAEPYRRPNVDYGLTDAWWEICLACWKWEPTERPTMRAIFHQLTDRPMVPVICTTTTTTHFIGNIDVAYGSDSSKQPPNAVQELTQQNNDINFEFGGDYVWLLAVPATNGTNVATGFQFVRQHNAIPGARDLAAGAGGDYRYLFPTYGPGGGITEVKLYRTGTGVPGPPPGYSGITSDINGGRKKTFLYLVWKTG